METKEIVILGLCTAIGMASLDLFITLMPLLLSPQFIKYYVTLDRTFLRSKLAMTQLALSTCLSYHLVK